MHARLSLIDPVAAAKIHPNDPQRLSRALEVYEITGQAMSVLQAKDESPSSLQFINVGLMPNNRAWLHERIAERLDQMLMEGFIDEVRALYHQPDLHPTLPALRAVGYRQAWQFLSGAFDEKTMREKILIATRQLAKRQMTWLRSWPSCHLLACDDKDFLYRHFPHSFS